MLINAFKLWLMAISVLGFVANVWAETKSLTILHTNDMHSNFLGFAPNIDYEPNLIGVDQTVGGWARLATAIKQIKQQRSNQVLQVDVGDFTIGTLFHSLAREEAFELRLLKAMGYDVLTLGNHEFDMKTTGLARMLLTAERHNSLPPIVASNIVFDPSNPDDDAFEQVCQRMIRPWLVIEKNGLRIGLFGLIGKSAAKDALMALPVTFEKPVTSAKKMVTYLREKEKVDIVVCLSHSGLSDDPDNSEDEILATKVPGIDVIISGHAHMRIERPRIVGNTIIVISWAYGRQLGVLDLEVGNGRCSLKGWRTETVDSQIPADGEITKQLESFERLVDEKFLAPKGLKFRQIVAHTNFDLTYDNLESNLGNMLADAVRWSANQYVTDPNDPGSQVVMAVFPTGMIRDYLLRGRSGDLAVCDIFRIAPQGIGLDDSIGFPLVSFFLTGAEIKKVLEAYTSVWTRKSDDYCWQISGAKFAYNPHRMILDRVTEIWLGNEEGGYSALDYSESNPRLYRLATNFQNAINLAKMGKFTWGILSIVPKDRRGQPLPNLNSAVITINSGSEGRRELKEWRAVVEYLSTRPDLDGDGLPDVPAKYRTISGRIVAAPSLNPYSLLRRGTLPTLATAAMVVIFAGLLLLGIRILRNKVRPYNRQAPEYQN